MENRADWDPEKARARQCFEPIRVGGAPSIDSSASSTREKFFTGREGGHLKGSPACGGNHAKPSRVSQGGQEGNVPLRCSMDLRGDTTFETWASSKSAGGHSNLRRDIQEGVTRGRQKV